MSKALRTLVAASCVMFGIGVVSCLGWGWGLAAIVACGVAWAWVDDLRQPGGVHRYRASAKVQRDRDATEVPRGR